MLREKWDLPRRQNMKPTRCSTCAALVVFALLVGCSDAPTNYAPFPEDDTASTGVDAPVTIRVLDNDFEWNGDPLTIVGFTQPAHGVVADNGDGTLTYTPPTAFIGFVVFEYTVADRTGLEGVATVSVAVGATAQLAITEAKGLFRPGGGGVGVYEAGYVSEDNQGRIYTNHAHAPADPGTTAWTKNVQYVDITLAVQPAGAVWPDDTRVVWEWEDVDDPSNEDALTHTEAGHTLDPNDYDHRDNDGDGTRDNSDGADNTGDRDGAPVWEGADAAHLLLNGNETTIANGVSSVRFNATDDGGDNFVVRASLKLTVGGEPVAVAETGVMTVWKRIDVEYVVMASATPLDGFVNGQVNASYAKAYVEMVAHERAVDDYLAGGDLQMGVNEYDASQACEAYVTEAGGEFKHEGDGGWFFCAAANHFVDSTGAGPTPYLYVGPSWVCSDGLTLQLPIGESLSDNDKYAEGDKVADRPPAGGYRVMKTDMVFTQADVFADGTLLYDYDPGWDTFDGQAPVISHTQGAAGDGAEITYAADADATNGYILVYKPFVSSVALWNPDDPSGLEYVIFRYLNFSWDPAWEAFGVWSKDYSTPTEYSCMSFDVIDHGFLANSIADTLVLGTGGLVVTGISPGPNGGLEGRTLVFTASGGDLCTLLHEFGHAFGFHHICGNWDYMSDGTTGQACPMHYDSWYFMLDHSTPRQLDLWTLDYGGPYFCEEHIIEIRRQNLEDLAVLGWGN
jgi:hypothetical protein